VIRRKVTLETVNSPRNSPATSWADCPGFETRQRQEIFSYFEVQASSEAHTAFNSVGKGTAVPLQAWSDPEGSRKLRFPRFMTTAQDVDKVVSLMHRPHLPPGNSPGNQFC
jgi:hypothetical protein